MERNRSLSFYHKKSEKNPTENTLSIKAKPNASIYENECNSTLPHNPKAHLSESTPLLTKLLGDLEGNPIFRQQRQKNERSKSIDFLTTKPVIPSSEAHTTSKGFPVNKTGSYRKSFSTNNLTVSQYIFIITSFVLLCQKTVA